MHWLAKQWDERQPKPKGSFMSDGTPKNRPCDWCGEKLKRGWIHEECAKKEREKWLDILF